MIRGFLNKFSRSFKNLKNVIFHVKLLSLTLSRSAFDKIEHSNNVIRQTKIKTYAYNSKQPLKNNSSVGGRDMEISTTKKCPW